MMTKTVLVAVVVGSLLLAGSAQAGVPGDSLCTEKKAKAAGKKAFDFMKAFGKNMKKPNATKLASEVSKAQSRFTKLFGKAELKGGCVTSGDAGLIEAKVDALVFDMVANIAAACGDDIRAGDEECDGSDDDACPGKCVPESGGGGVCGANVINGGVACTCAPEDCDGTADGACPGICQANCRCPEPVCGNGVVEAGEVCEPPGVEGPPCGAGEICSVGCGCVPALPCDCGTPDPPTALVQTTRIESGICGVVRDGDGIPVKDLECSKTYVGNNDPGVPTGTPLGIGAKIFPVEACYGTTLVLANSTAAETGSWETCTSTGCRFGAPVPIIHPLSNVLSICADEYVIDDAFGYVDCSTGEAAIRLPIESRNHLHGFGDTLRFRCSGGSDPGLRCANDSDCPDGGTCEFDEVPQPCPICNPDTLRCNGGPNNGLPCTPDTPEISPQYPTSNDCPPNPAALLVGVVSPFASTTAAEATIEATDGNFCGFCRDSDSLCFEGNPDTHPVPGQAGCPDSAVIPDCQPASYHDPELTGSIDGCGTAIPCKSSADCYAPYESCEQALAGAFGIKEAPPRSITEWGSPAGDLRDRSVHDVRPVSLFCVPPTWDSYVDNTSKFPSPGAVAMTGTFRLQPSPGKAFLDLESGVLD